VRAGLDDVAGLFQELADVARMRLLIVSGRTLKRVAMAICGRARRWCRTVARSRSARVRTGRRPVPGAVSRGRWPRRLSRLVSRCWSCSGISAAVRASQVLGRQAAPVQGVAGEQPVLDLGCNADVSGRAAADRDEAMAGGLCRWLFAGGYVAVAASWTV
jgi:hypothetical protein